MDKKPIAKANAEEIATESRIATLLEKFTSVKKESDGLYHFTTIVLVVMTILISLFTWQINSVKTDLQERMRTEIQAVRTEIANTNVRIDDLNVRIDDLKEDIKELREDARERDRKIDEILRILQNRR